MSAIFISHRSTDDAVAADVHVRLEAEGHRSVFLDFDPADGIPAGRNWEREIYEQMRVCRAVIVLCSEESMQSKWVFAEITQARALGKFILPVKVADCTIDSLISDRQIIDMTKDKEEAYSRLQKGLLTAGIEPDDAFAWDGVRPPYPGLLSFHEEDAAVFFGRDNEITDGLGLMNRIRRHNVGEWAMILGASGAGKSSLIRAGLVPRLRRDQERWLVVDPFRPKDDPIRELSGVLAASLRKVGDERDWRSIYAILAAPGSDSGNSTVNPIVESAHDLLAQARQTDARVLLVIDQFEELLGHRADHPASKLLTLLRAAARTTDSPIVVLATIRSDFLGAFQNSQSLRSVPYQSLTVGPMASDAITRIIEQPAAIAGLELETGLTSLLVADTGTADALPLLAFTLRELYEEYSGDRQLTVSDYRDGLGGLHGAIAKVADELIETERFEEGQLDLLRRGFLTMVRLTDDERWAKTVARWDDLPEPIHSIINRFVTARLLISGEGHDGHTIEVAHEALFRSWGLLAEWLDDNRTELRLLADIKRTASTWSAEGRAPDYEWRGERLANAIELRDSGDLRLDAIDKEFLHVSEQARLSDARTEEKRRRKRLQVAAGIATGATALAIVALFFFFRANDHATIAEQQTAIANSEASRADQSAVIAMSRQADALIATDPALAVGVAAEALGRSEIPETKRVVAKANAALRATHLVLDVDDHDGAVLDVDFNHDGSRFATSSADGSARVWDTDSGDVLVTFRGHTTVVLGVAFNNDGTMLATASADGTARLWDSTTGEVISVFEGHDAPVLDIAFSPDGRWIATSSGDETAVVTNVDSGQELVSLVGHNSPVWSVDFSPDGSHIVTAAGDGTARIWDASTGIESQVLSGHTDVVFDAVFSPTGTHLVTASADGTARIWDRLTGVEVSSFTGHTDAVRGVTYKRDGTGVVTISNDETARLWEPSTGNELLTLEGHAGIVRGVAVNAEGTTIATTGNDATAKLWDASANRALAAIPGSGDPAHAVAFAHGGDAIVTATRAGVATVWTTGSRDRPLELSGHEGSIWAVTVSTDDTIIATASDDGTARTWDSETGDALVTFSGHRSRVRGVALNSDGTTIATASDDGTARLWQTASGGVALTLTGHAGPVRGVDISSDDAKVATASADGTARVWNASTGEELAVLIGHTDTVTAVSFNADGTRIATASGDGTARLWEADTGTEIVIFEGHRGWVLDVDFNNDGSRLVTASGDGTTRIWDTHTAEELDTLGGDTGPVWGAAYDITGDHIATAGSDGTTRLWTTDPGDSCSLIMLLVTSAELTDAIGGSELVACTNLGN